jgi:hypothetical protein
MDIQFMAAASNKFEIILKIGIALPHAGQQATRGNVIQMAKLDESDGSSKDFLWPTNPQTPYRAAPDGSLVTVHQKVLDPLETLTYVAANTYDYLLEYQFIKNFFDYCH